MKNMIQLFFVKAARKSIINYKKCRNISKCKIIIIIIKAHDYIKLMIRDDATFY